MTLLMNLNLTNVKKDVQQANNNTKKFQKIAHLSLSAKEQLQLKGGNTDTNDSIIEEDIFGG